MNKEEQKLTLIRAGLTNYLGSFITSGCLSKEKAREYVVAVLCEEVLRLLQDEDQKVRFFEAVPVLASASFILKSREYEYLAETGEDISTSPYKRIYEALDNLTEKMKGVA